MQIFLKSSVDYVHVLVEISRLPYAVLAKNKQKIRPLHVKKCGQNPLAVVGCMGKISRLKRTVTYKDEFFGRPRGKKRSVERQYKGT